MEWNATRPAPPSREELSAAIGPKADIYRARFAGFARGDGPRFAFSWNWPAFFAGTWWYLYRKMYGWALLDFALSAALGWTLFVPLLWAVARAVTGDYLYFLRVRRRVLESRSPLAAGGPVGDTLHLERLSREGGVHAWVPRVAAAGIVLLLLLSALLFGALWEAIPPLRDLWSPSPGRWT